MPDDEIATPRRVGLRPEAQGSIEQALTAVARFDFNPAPRILVTGSLYLAGEVLALNGTVPV